jgi:hypothetical protein
VLNLALLSYPNILVELREPLAVRRGRMVTAVAHRLDDAAAFERAVAQRIAAPATQTRSSPQAPAWFG